MQQLISSAAMRMTSVEIADMVEKRHDNVKRTIETLVEQSVISLPQIEEVKTQRERRLAEGGVIPLPPLVEYLDSLGRPAFFRNRKGSV